ncbi:hypothetical protein [Dissulfurimicrobium hydrothermale]|nr:hypothetical protein [Dissulfurimicrobium hydrothermale]UKL13324.1 hypothetical protein LGS26_07495 [Dissulfurimicrobium hydrothermale]
MLKLRYDMRLGPRNIKYVLSILTSSLWMIIGSSGSACAFQAHGSPEGLYAHQFAHILYASSVTWLGYRIKRSGLMKNRPWRLISISMFILAWWNIWAFCGHIIEYMLPSGHLGPIPGTDRPGILVASWLDIAYYILKFDNLISVPALWLIYMALAEMKKTVK